MYTFPLLSKRTTAADLNKLSLEMDLARRVQLSLFPKIPPEIAGVDLWGLFRPASHVGGDFYDFIARPDQPLTFFIGDVSGKGMPAALLMTMARAILRGEITSPVVSTPEMILQNANAKLLADFAGAGMFVTVFVGQYYPATKELVFANAGHSPIIFRPAHQSPRLLEADGTPLGLSETSFSKNHRLSLADGDLLLALTDGLSDARSSHDECFGMSK